MFSTPSSSFVSSRHQPSGTTFVVLFGVLLLATTRSKKGVWIFERLLYFYSGGGGLTISMLVQFLYKQRHRTNPGTEAEPQQIVAQRLLSCLQYHVP